MVNFSPLDLSQTVERTHVYPKFSMDLWTKKNKLMIYPCYMTLYMSEWTLTWSKKVWVPVLLDFTHEVLYDTIRIKCLQDFHSFIPEDNEENPQIWTHHQKMCLAIQVSWGNHRQVSMHMYCSTCSPLAYTTNFEVYPTSGRFSHGSMGSMEPPFCRTEQKYIQADPFTHSLERTTLANFI